MLSRRTLLTLPALAACSRNRGVGYQGYAFIANEEGQAVAAVDLEAMAVARHIPLKAAPTQVIAAQSRPLVYALTPENGTVHEIHSDRLSLSRSLAVGSKAVSMQFAPDERSLFVLTREPRALASLSVELFHVEWRLPLPETPVDMAVAAIGRKVAVSCAQGLWLVDVEAKRVSGPLAKGEFGSVRFLSDGKVLIVANLADRLLSFFDVAAERLITHLPVAVRPDALCFNQDGGQLFVTGEGMDAVVVVYPYHTPEVAETVLAGHAPGAMAVSASLLFIASPQSGDVSTLNIPTRKVIAVTQVGTDPGFIAITPDDQYALVLNRKSGDVAVLRVQTITPNRYKAAALLTVIPVGSRPVSAAVRGV